MARAYNYKFASIKKVILFIWSYRCYICKKQSPFNDVHHVNENPFDNGSHNLLPLCKRCHKLAHKNIKIENIVYPDEVAKQLWILDEVWKSFD